MLLLCYLLLVKLVQIQKWRAGEMNNDELKVGMSVAPWYLSWKDPYDLFKINIYDIPYT